MLLRILLAILVIAFFAACNNTPTNADADRGERDLTSTRDLSNSTIDVDELKQFLDLFPVVLSLEFNEALFKKHEEGEGLPIPIEMDINILKTEHKGYDGTDDFFPETMNTAVAKFRISAELWGLIVMNHEMGTDGRNQSYRIYTIDGRGEIRHMKDVAASIGWQNGFINEIGHLSQKDGLFQIKTLSIYADWGETEDRVYPYQANENKYVISKEGMITDVSNPCFLLPKDPMPEEYRLFDGIELIKNEINEKAVGIDWQHWEKTKSVLAWRDSNGDNYVLFALRDRKEEKELTFVGKPVERTLHACHYTIKNGHEKRLWEMNDYELVCEFDLFMDYLYKSVSLTDIDKNGVAEICFMYSLGCISDVSPVDVKLMLYENGQKYALRGNSRISSELRTKKNNQPNYKIDEMFENAPKGFLDFAKTHWEQYDVIY